jgi:hypothetical protein
MELRAIRHACYLGLLLGGSALAECVPPSLPDFMSGSGPTAPTAAEFQAASQQHNRFIRDKQAFHVCLGQEVQATIQRGERPNMPALREQMDKVDKQEQAEQRQFSDYTQRAAQAARVSDAIVTRDLLFQDDKVTIYDDTQYSSQTHKQFVAQLDLTVVHKAGVDEPLFEVKASQRDGADYYEYGPSVMQDFARQLPNVFDSKRFSTVTMRHYVEGQVLPPNRFFPMKMPLGSPVAEVTFMNDRNGAVAIKESVQVLDARVFQGLPPPGWTYYGKSAGQTDRTFIARRLLNTYAAAELGHYPDKPVVAPIEKAMGEAPQDLTSTGDSSPENFGYMKYQHLLTVGKTAYFVVDMGTSNDLKLVAIHSVGEQEPVVDLDVFPMIWGMERVLGYFYTEDAIEAFNRDLGARLDKLRNDEKRVWIHHYVRGHALPGPMFSAADRPVFVASFTRTATGWMPEYRVLQDLRPVGLFGPEQRYSYASSLQARQAYEQYKRSGFPAKQAWQAEADEYYRHASKGALARRSRYALWTEGYWLFNNRAELGRNLIDGKFERIPLDDSFTFFYSFFLLHYSHQCHDHMKNPTSFKHTETTRHHTGYGAYWDEVSSSSVIHMEQRFATKYEEYFRKGAPEPGKVLFKIPDTVFPIRAFSVKEPCQSPTMQRLLENLYRRSQGMPALALDASLL